MNVDSLGEIAEASGANSRSGAAPAGDEFEGVLRQTLGTEEVEAELSQEAPPEDAGREETSGEDLEAAQEQAEAAAENLSEGAIPEALEVESARVFTGELGNVATVEQRALPVAAGAAETNAREPVEPPNSDEAILRNPTALSNLKGSANELGQQQTVPDALSGERGRGAERTEPTQVAEEAVVRDQVVQETSVQSHSTASAETTEVVTARAEFANEVRSSESPAATSEQNALTLEGATTEDRQERDRSEDARTTSPADLSRENLSAEVRTESGHAPPEHADRAVVPGPSTGAEAASTNPVSTPLVAAPLAVEQAAAPGSPIPPPAADAVAVQTEWLVSRGGGSARLVLHPQELGEIAIRVTVRDGVVDVVMVAQEGAAKAIAEQQGDRLMQAFANRDLRMENFEVRRGDAASLGNEGDPSFREPGGGQGQTDAGDEGRHAAAADSGHGFDRSIPVPGQSVLPQIVSVAKASGVDLRI